MKLEIAYYGNPVLRKKGELVKEITRDITRLVDDMFETMAVEDGIGLAAPQIGQSLAIFVTHVPIQIAEDKWEEGTKRVFINPKIISISEEFWIASEGCLSIPKVYGDVNRPLKITVEALNADGEKFTQEFTHLEARCIMHENDHINGTLFIDRVHGQERKDLDKKLREVKNNFTKKK